MLVLYEESGDFRIGSILSESDASLQVEAPHGKRSKIKAAHVLLRFDDASPADFLARAETAAGGVDIDFLWEVSGADEFGFEALAREYYGRAPTALEAATILVRLHGAPVYFHRRGKGRYRAAPPDILKAALAAVEKKRQQQLRIDEWAAALERFEMPADLVPLIPQLLYKPDRNRVETRAFEQACDATGLSPARLIERCGALPPTDRYHLGRFLFEHFPRGVGFPHVDVPPLTDDLPLADVQAFSLDDAATTEIDDAFSVTRTEGGVRIGVHIAAPALGFAPGSPIDAIARERLSTVYMPGDKITMLPTEVVQRYTLAEGGARPAVSLYVDVEPETLVITGEESRVELVPIAANLRHQDIDHLNETLADGHADPAVPFAADIELLHRFAGVLQAARGKSDPVFERKEYSFEVESDRVRIVERKRGAPLDKLVSELMILVNATWGRVLDERGAAALYRAQGPAGKVRMTTVAAGHDGLGVSHYAWSSSPLRRYVDLVNQRQLVATLRGDAPPYPPKSADLLAVLRDFESTYAAYDEFQRGMEHYWCLRWLLQENVAVAPADVIREGLVRFADIPLVTRVVDLPDLAQGTRVMVEIAAIDLVDSTLRCVYKRSQPIEEVA
jgi:exoribonuclease II